MDGGLEIERHDVDKSKDEFTQPLCAIGGQQGHLDYGGPSDFCCRIYESIGWMGRYYDLCAGDGFGADRPTFYDLMAEGWDNEMSSYKCGEKVGIMMCDRYYSDPDMCKPHESESGMPGTQNGEIGLSNKVTTVNIVFNHPYSATIYSREDCRGRSAWLKTDNSIAGSWTEYDADSNELLQDGDVMSAKVSDDMELDFFSNGNFASDSYALRFKGKGTCTELAFLSEVFGGRDHIDHDGDTNIHGAWLHRTWFANSKSVPVGFNDVV